MRFIALLIAIGLLKAAKRVAWVAELMADGGVWIIDQCDPEPRWRK